MTVSSCAHNEVPKEHLAGLWEFPGGKIEPEETARDALEPAIAAELGCVVEVGNEVTTTSHVCDFGVVTLTTFLVPAGRGNPGPGRAPGHQVVGARGQGPLAWAPVDIPAVELI